MTVFKCRFISSGEIITAGRDFLISEPTDGSKETKNTSNLFISMSILLHHFSFAIFPMLQAPDQELHLLPF